MILFRNMLKRVDESRYPSQTPIVVQNQSPMLIEVFGDSDTVDANVVLLHCCPQSCMPNPVEGLLEVYEDMVEALPVLEIFLTGFLG